MFLSSWLTRKPTRPHKSRTRLGCEHLEDRSVPATYTAATVPELIAAINTANSTPVADTILLAANTTFDLTAVNNTTNGRNGLPVIAAAGGPLSIVGQGGDIIQRDPSQGPFRFLDVASGGNLTLSQVTLQHGSAIGYDAYGGYGGAIFNQGTLVLNGVTVQNNGAAGLHSNEGAGGGIWSSGRLTLKNGTVVTNNYCSGAEGRTHSVAASGRAVA